jgi:hypothetical protein
MRALRSFAAIVMIWSAGRGLLLYVGGAEAKIALPFAVKPPAIAEASPPLIASPASDAHRQRRAVANGRNLQSRPKWLPVQNSAIGFDRVSVPMTIDNISPAPVRPNDMQEHVPSVVAHAGDVPKASILAQPLVTGSGYIFMRSGRSPRGLSPGNNLGGSQASFRLTGPELVSVKTWRLQPFARATGALDPADFDEAALGMTLGKRWPSAFASASVEHRFRTGRNGRNAIAASLAGGMATSLPATGLTLSGYGQAGFVGLSRRDAFADAEIRIETAPIPTTANIRLGLAAWGGVQPGVSRVDVGPSLSLPIKAGAASLSIRADWRFRVAGKAQPGSGPALTLATDF